LISSDTIATTLAVSPRDLQASQAAVSSGEIPLAEQLQPNSWNALLPYTAILGNPNMAMLLSTAIALGLVVMTLRPTLTQLGEIAERALMSGGVIILITSGGGAFGAMLKEAEIGQAIERMFQSESGEMSGLMFLLMGYFIAVLLKIAQGSTTVAMITTSGMLAAMLTGETSLGYHRIYLATAIGAGALMGSWMNDSGFWIFAKMGGLTEAESLKSWTVLLAILSVTSMLITLLLASTVPLA
jgi:H+/gluconate symporter-like permease